MILHALILGTAAALSGFLMNALESRPVVELLYWGFPFGAVLAAYLWVVLSVRSFAKVLLVSLMAEAAFYFATLGSMFVGLIAGPRHYKAQTELNMMSLVAGTIAGGLVLLGFLAAVPWPRENTRVDSEMLLRASGVLLCAAAGGLFGAAGALLEDLSPTTTFIFLGGVWQGGMGVVLAVIADLLLARSSADTPAAENA